MNPPFGNSAPVLSRIPDIEEATSPPEIPVITFPRGIPGFPTVVDYELAPAGAGKFWLRGRIPGGPTFLVVDPERFGAHPPELPTEVRFAVEESPGHPTRVLAMVTLPGPERPTPTMNLQGILAVNPSRGLGMQVILPEESGRVRVPLRRPGDP